MIVFHLSIVDVIGVIVVPVLLPLLVGLVTTRETHAGRKAVLLALLAAVTSLCTQAVEAWQSGHAFDLGAALLLVIPTFVIAVAMHFGVWKPAGAAAALQDVGAHAVVESTAQVVSEETTPAPGVTAVPHVDTTPRHAAGVTEG